MRYGALTLVGLAALAASIDTASARDGCGRGRAWNGYACVPDPYYQPPPPPPGYGGGYYGGGGGYQRPGYGGGYGGGYHQPVNPGDLGPQTNRGQDCYNVGGQRICCPKGWTVQGGACKPYSGR
jgi:hypothetical protein